jgi:hypothetical protein
MVQLGFALPTFRRARLRPISWDMDLIVGQNKRNKVVHDHILVLGNRVTTRRGEGAEVDRIRLGLG